MQKLTPEQAAQKAAELEELKQQWAERFAEFSAAWKPDSRRIYYPFSRRAARRRGLVWNDAVESPTDKS